MADIKVLPKELAELIAAGEVVERPASVIKELVENAIDAGADKITVEINRGGITYMRVTDNGSGIRPEQVRTAFLRHATSKLKTKEDLFKIGTLGFRGEALASISAVARVELLTKTADSELGVRYVIEGGEEIEFEESGCPEGTTIVVRDLFFNTPARMKFLKKDVAEGTAVASVIDAIALSHPEISVRFIKDSKSILATTGDGKLESAVYAVLGRDFASSMIPASSETDGVKVSGLICKPVYCRPTRSGQYFFINDRYIRSGVIAKALDQAYKSSVMVGKFPACVLNLSLPPELVDVNVHPAKTEVRFSNERVIFDAVYYAVKNALAQGDTRPTLELKSNPIVSSPDNSFQRMTVEDYKKLVDKKKTERTPTIAEQIYNIQVTPQKKTTVFADYGRPLVSDKEVKVAFTAEPTFKAEEKEDYAPLFHESNNEGKLTEAAVNLLNMFSDEKTEFVNETILPEEEIEFIYIGEAFKTYIIVQFKGSIYFIDKHAAHERMLYEKLKEEGVVEVQTLLSPVAVTLSRAEHRAVLDNIDLLKTAGFEVEEFGTVSVLVRAVPASLVKVDVMFLMCDIAANLVKFGKAETEILDDLYHNIACRSAVKGGNTQSDAELEAFARKLLANNEIMYCPYGRPVAFELKRSELEKQFGRTQ